MNEDSFGATAPLPPEYKDRHAGLVFFGIVTVLMGCLAGLFVLLMLIGPMATAHAGQPATPLKMLLPTMATYAFLAVALIWLGIGSTLARRWARALILIFSWCWLIVGVWTLAFMAYLMPKMFANIPAGAVSAQQQGTVQAIMIVTMVFMAGLFIVLPAIWVAFYSGRNVKATCEARDPVPRWTDATPLPVLGLCLFLVFSAVTMLAMALTGPWPLPMFGAFATGIPATLSALVMAAAWAYAAWAMYKLELRGWWATVIVILLFGVSSALTFAHHNITEMYSQMNIPAAQIEQIQKSGLFMGNGMVWMSIAWMVPFLGYVIFVRKYFRAAA